MSWVWDDSGPPKGALACGPGRTIHRARLYGLVTAIGLAATVPLLLFGFPHPTCDEVWHLRWWHHFSAQFWAGEPYPRWLADINYGLGSPSFFYYPPLPYWVSALFRPVAGSCLPGWRALGWASGLAVVVSGLGALACFRKLAPDKPAVVAAAIYMLAPYHLAIDLLERGAYAEHWAFVWMPVVVGGIVGLRQGERLAWLKTALGWAGLFLTHLPTTVTFTPMALAYALWMGTGTFLRACMTLWAGVGLASVYLVPALTTQAAVSMQHLEFPYYTAFFFPTLQLSLPVARPIGPDQRLLICYVGLAVAVGCCYLTTFVHGAREAAVRQRLAWLSLGGCLLLLMLPVSDWLYAMWWPLRMIQFPYRFLAPGTLVLAALVAVYWPGRKDRLWAWGLYGTMLAVTGLSVVALTSRAYGATCLSGTVRWGQPPASVDPNAEDVAEYRPAQARLEAARALLGQAQVKVISGTAHVEVLGWRPRQLQFAVQASGPAQLLVRQFWYPGWAAMAADGSRLPVEVEATTGVLGIEVPAGAHRISVVLKPQAAEWLGRSISVVSVLGCLGKWCSDRRRPACVPTLTEARS